MLESASSFGSLGPLELLAVGAAAVLGGAVNALAGGGTLITFPVLTAVGLPALAANITNTVALCPGHVGATLAQAASLRGQRKLLLVLVPAGIAGGLVGGVLLLHTGEHTFRDVVPLLLLFSSLLLASQEKIRAFLQERQRRRGGEGGHARLAPFVVGTAAVYGGYFGAGLGVVLVAALGIVLDETLPRLNALKQVVALVVNVAAAVFFLFSDQVNWMAPAAMAVGALAGGAIGGHMVTRVNVAALRWGMVALGVVLALIYLVN
ncbi:MAG: sulfite exporter TauE/SafE family protein [Candidatus Binatia bacterium]